MAKHSTAVRLGRVLRAKREAAALGRDQFADRIGMHSAYYAAIERGEKRVMLRTLKQCADGFGIPISELLRDMENHSSADESTAGIPPAMSSNLYVKADETINSGLSLGARMLMSSVAMLFGAAMVAIATSASGAKAVTLYGFGAFCLLIATASFTAGRARQFVGSAIGVAIFLAGVAYLVSEIAAGKIISASRGEPSIRSALLYLFFIGVPGLTYAIKARFGLRRK